MGQVEPEGVLEVVSRVDIDRLAQQLPGEVAPVWVQALEADDATQDLPVAVPEPDFTDSGPHLLYAIQWFAFAIIGVVGFFFLIRGRAVRHGDPVP